MQRMKDKDAKGHLLFLLRHLQQNTDDQHLVTTPDSFSVLEFANHRVDRKTFYDDINVLREDFDIDIITEKYRGSEYFISSRESELLELKLLINVAMSPGFTSIRENRRPIGKLSPRASVWHKKDLEPHITIDERIKALVIRVYYTTDMLDSAIKRKRQVNFQYVKYDSRRRKVLRNGDEVCTNSPYDCLWNNSKYYPIEYSEKH